MSETTNTNETETATEAAEQAPVTEKAAPTADAGRVAALEAEVAQLKDQVLRAMAEAENIRRRAEREREDTSKYAVAKFAKDLLGAADNLRRAVESVTPETRAENAAVGNLLTGVEATERQLTASFERAGIVRMEAMGQPADPNFHQIMMEMEGTGKQPGTVVQVLQPGYTIHGRLLREAIVGVAKGGEAGHVKTSA